MSGPFLLPDGDVGRTALAWLRDQQLQVDPDFTCVTRNGFCWWPGPHRQSLEITQRREDREGDTACLLTIQTDLFRIGRIDERAALGLNTLVSPFATMSGPMFDADAGLVRLSTALRLHKGILDWMLPLASVAAVVQLAEASRCPRALAEALGAEPATSAAPGRVLRARLLDHLLEIDARFTLDGEGHNRWAGAEFEDTVDSWLCGPPALLAQCEHHGLTVEFPYGSEQSSLCRVGADQPHVRYGSGLTLRQDFDCGARPALEGARLALEINRQLSFSLFGGYGFGSTSFQDGTLRFQGFLPNALWRAGLLPNLVLSAAERAEFVSLQLTGEGWTEASFDPSRSALRRVMRVERGG